MLREVFKHNNSEVPAQPGGRKGQSWLVGRWASTIGGFKDAAPLDINTQLACSDLSGVF